MKFIIKHEVKGRIRLHLAQPRMSFAEADTLLYYLEHLNQVKEAKVYERTADAAVVYTGSREELLAALRRFRYENVQVPEGFLEIPEEN